MHIGGIFCDPAKEFVGIMRFFLQKLKYYGKGSILDWFKSHLINRKQKGGIKISFCP
jgi:hypothetical protein